MIHFIFLFQTLTQRGPCRDGEGGADPGSLHFSVPVSKANSAICRGGFRADALSAKKRTEAIQQVANNQF